MSREISKELRKSFKGKVGLGGWMEEPKYDSPEKIEELINKHADMYVGKPFVLYSNTKKEAKMVKEICKKLRFSFYPEIITEKLKGKTLKLVKMTLRELNWKEYEDAKKGDRSYKPRL